jgi:hypothetical protein
MILDVATADLAMAEDRLGSFHETAWFFRNALEEARRSWDRLRAEFGSSTLEAGLAEPPVAVLTLGNGSGRERRVNLILIGGKTYQAERLAPTELATSLWRLVRLPVVDDGGYYLGRLRDGSAHCDCADWIYQAAESNRPTACKHLVALEALEWL